MSGPHRGGVCKCGKHFWVGNMSTGNWVAKGFLVNVAVVVGTACDGDDCGDTLLAEAKIKEDTNDQ